MNRELRHQASLVSTFVLAVVVAVLALYKLNRASASSAIKAGPRKATVEINPQKTANQKPIGNPQPKLTRYAEIASASDRRRWIVDQLRAMGVPNDTLALVARVDFEVQWDSRFDACLGDRDKLDAVQQEMNMSKDAEMRAALGEAGFRQWDQKNMLWEAMSTAVDTTASESAAIYDSKKKLQQRLLDLEQARLKGTMDDAEISDAQDKAYAEYFQQLKDTLGDERYAKSQQLDDAFNAGRLRHELANVNPSDAQFEELFKADKEYNKFQLELDPSAPGYAAQLKALNDARDQTYRQVLGADAFDTLQKQQDPGYSEMKKYEELWGLDDGKIDYVYNTMKQYEKSVEDYKGQINALLAQGQNVNGNVVSQKLQELAGQTQQTLQSYLGQDNFNRLERNRVLKFAGVRLSQ